MCARCSLNREATQLYTAAQCSVVRAMRKSVLVYASMPSGSQSANLTIRLAVSLYLCEMLPRSRGNTAQRQHSAARACDANIRLSIVQPHNKAGRKPVCALSAPSIKRQHSAAAAQCSVCVRCEKASMCNASMPSGSRSSDLTIRLDARLCVC